jgi:hypothetical protein
MISPWLGVYGFGGEALYYMTKFAQVGFAQALDRELWFVFSYVIDCWLFSGRRRDLRGARE